MSTSTAQLLRENRINNEHRADAFWVCNKVIFVLYLHLHVLPCSGIERAPICITVEERIWDCIMHAAGDILRMHSDACSDFSEFFATPSSFE